ETVQSEYSPEEQDAPQDNNEQEIVTGNHTHPGTSQTRGSPRRIIEADPNLSNLMFSSDDEASDEEAGVKATRTSNNTSRSEPPLQQSRPEELTSTGHDHISEDPQPKMHNVLI
ncbi:unnamed protein product, partial [Allacma fusca]